jgi:response regulator RpfG family c-di-GMP phosphodiesterase
MQPEKILVVDDEEVVVRTLNRFLKTKGFDVAEANNGEEALLRCSEFKPDLVLLDVRMPKMDGLTCLRELKMGNPDVEVVMVTAMGEVETAISAMQKGAFGYLLKPVDFNALYVEVKRALEHHALTLEVKDYQKNLEIKVDQRTQEIQQLNEKLRKSFLESVRILVSLLEHFNPFLGGHSKRVAFLAREIGTEMNLGMRVNFQLEMGGLLHDIGTVAIPERLNQTPIYNLTDEEVHLIKSHPIFAQNIISKSEEIGKAGKIIRHHLEHVDGSGFPDGLKGDEIPLESKILGVVNAYDELKNRRRFSKDVISSDKMQEDFAYHHLYKLAGKHYDKSIIDVLKDVTTNLNFKKKGEEKIGIDDLKPSSRLSRNLFTVGGDLVLSKGMVLDSLLIEKLKAFYSAKLLENSIYIYRRNE